jgi:uncharacterized protein
MTRLLDRHAERVALQRLVDARGVVVNGPRQSGKSELLRVLQRRLGGELVTLDHPHALRSARTDPTGFLDRARPTFIDEVQRGGNPLVLAIKVVLDASQDRGRVVLAGSTRFLTEPRLSESLAGRVRFLDLWPLAQGEIDESGPRSDRFVDLLLTSVDELRDMLLSLRGERRGQTFERVVAGGFPEAVLAASPRARRDFHLDYVRTVSQRDINEYGRLAQRMDLPRTLRLLAERTATVTNRAALGKAVGVSADVMGRYLPLVETIFLSTEIPAFASSSAARTRRRPKQHLTDTGLASALLGVDAARLARPESTVAGSLLETFVAMELMKQATWSDETVTFAHYRDADQREVDLVIETPDGRIAAVEVKAAVDVDERDFGPMALLRQRLGERFVQGVVVHCGERIEAWGDRLTSVPVTALWAPHVASH